MYLQRSPVSCRRDLHSADLHVVASHRFHRFWSMFAQQIPDSASVMRRCILLPAYHVQGGWVAGGVPGGGPAVPGAAGRRRPGCAAGHPGASRRPRPLRSSQAASHRAPSCCWAHSVQGARPNTRAHRHHRSIWTAIVNVHEQDASASNNMPSHYGMCRLYSPRWEVASGWWCGSSCSPQ